MENRLDDLFVRVQTKGFMPIEMVKPFVGITTNAIFISNIKIAKGI